MCSIEHILECSVIVFGVCGKNCVGEERRRGQEICVGLDVSLLEVVGVGLITCEGVGFVCRVDWCRGESIESILTCCIGLTTFVVAVLSWKCANAIVLSGTNMVPEIVERMTKVLTVLALFMLKLRVVALESGSTLYGLVCDVDTARICTHM